MTPRDIVRVLAVGVIATVAAQLLDLGVVGAFLIGIVLGLIVSQLP